MEWDFIALVPAVNPIMVAFITAKVVFVHFPWYNVFLPMIFFYGIVDDITSHERIVSHPMYFPVTKVNTAVVT